MVSSCCSCCSSHVLRLYLWNHSCMSQRPGRGHLLQALGCGDDVSCSDGGAGLDGFKPEGRRKSDGINPPPSVKQGVCSLRPSASELSCSRFPGSRMLMRRMIAVPAPAGITPITLVFVAGILFVQKNSFSLLCLFCSSFSGVRFLRN